MESRPGQTKVEVARTTPSILLTSIATLDEAPGSHYAGTTLGGLSESMACSYSMLRACGYE